MDGLETLAAALIEAAPDGVVVSQRGMVVFTNRGAARMFGFENAEALAGVPVAVLLAPEDLRISTGAHAVARICQGVRKGGGTLRAEVTSSCFEWKGAPAILTFVRDASDQARSTEQLAMTDRLAALGTLVAGVAHEINNPMTTVLIGLQVIQRALEQGLPGLAGKKGDLLSLITDLERSAMRVVDIVRDLRRFSHAGDGERTEVSLPEVLHHAERLVTHALEGRVKLASLHPPTPKVIGNAARIEQVAVNLMLNAAQAIPEDQEGLVNIRTFVAADGRVGFEVSDNGSGISSEHLPHIFEPFFTTKPVGVGTGLGLAISQTIVKDLGGELRVESQKGQGATFQVLLPRA